MANTGVLRKLATAKAALDRASAAEQLARERFESTVVLAANDGASQREIAHAAGVSQPYVSQVLRRRRRRLGTPRSAEDPT